MAAACEILSMANGITATTCAGSTVEWFAVGQDDAGVHLQCMTQDCL
jgi:hypothetical protein